MVRIDGRHVIAMDDWRVRPGNAMDVRPRDKLEFIMWTCKSMLRTIAIFMSGWLLAGAAISCNTMEGAGEDVERAGENIQDVADDARD